MRVFSLALNLINCAEVHHRLRVMRKNELKDKDSHVGPLPNVEDGARGTIEAIIANKEASKDEIFNALISQKIEIVLTAHPTEGTKAICASQVLSFVSSSNYTI